MQALLICVNCNAYNINNNCNNINILYNNNNNIVYNNYIYIYMRFQIIKFLFKSTFVKIKLTKLELNFLYRKKFRFFMKKFLKDFLLSTSL
jgi:hypothetical protein